jgi:uncharacterized membrane protein
MTEPDQALLARLSSDVAVMGAYLARASADLGQLQRLVASRATQPPDRPAAWSPAARWHPPVATPRGVEQTVAAGTAPSDGWIGRVLGVVGVTVTLVGVVLLLVLAAQAGILRPEVRVSAGVVLAAGLLGVARWLRGRPGGRVGAIAPAATGMATAYVDVIAVTAIYGWIPPATGLLFAAALAAAGLMLARRWNTQRLGLLVLVPLIGLAPVVADGFTALLVGFMLALSLASVPIQLGRDWIGMHAARMAASTVPLLVALAVERSSVLLATVSAAAAVVRSAVRWCCCGRRAVPG